ncbi:MAG: hypothetical protein H6603_01210 [Flavobacteriales bacterium]|nr:hypothetical protein [Flavobacteriales bacterium]MCB9203568.1 hypothetical protein [Flavobacteriales bacterium]
MIGTTDTIQVEKLSNIHINETENGFVVALTDQEGFEIVRGFGDTVTKALNDMHGNLI